MALLTNGLVTKTVTIFDKSKYSVGKAYRVKMGPQSYDTILIKVEDNYLDFLYYNYSNDGINKMDTLHIDTNSGQACDITITKMDICNCEKENVR